MSNLLNKLKKLSFFTHYPKKYEIITIDDMIEEYTSKEEMWEEWFANNIRSAKIVNQKALSDASVNMKRTYMKSGSYYYHYVAITKYRPSVYHPSQTGCMRWYYYKDSSYRSHSISSSSLRNSTLETTGIKKTTTTAPDEVKYCNIQVVIYPYYDTVNNIYYTGVRFKATGSSLTSSAKSCTKSSLGPTQLYQDLQCTMS